MLDLLWRLALSALVLAYGAGFVMQARYLPADAFKSPRHALAGRAIGYGLALLGLGLLVVVWGTR